MKIKKTSIKIHNTCIYSDRYDYACEECQGKKFWDIRPTHQNSKEIERDTWITDFFYSGGGITYKGKFGVLESERIINLKQY